MTGERDPESEELRLLYKVAHEAWQLVNRHPRSKDDCIVFLRAALEEHDRWCQWTKESAKPT